MKRMLVLFGIVVLLAAGGCSQSSVDAKDDTVRFPQYEAPNFPPYSTDNVFSH